MLAYNFTSDVRDTLAAAREEASRLGHDYVGTEHLALAVLRTPGGSVAAVLAPLDRAALIGELERRSHRGHSSAAAADLPYTSRGKRVLELAMHEARELGHEAVDTEHLLLGLLREERGIGAQVLRASGLTLRSTREAVLLERLRTTGGTRRRRPSQILLRVLAWMGLAPRN